MQNHLPLSHRRKFARATFTPVAAVPTYPSELNGVVMQKVSSGVLNFQDKVFPAKRDLFQGLAGGQQPHALFITCSDSRIDPNLLTQTEPGELFVLRNAGNLVPPYGDGLSGEAATIEYAISVLKVPDIIVCGHSCCGAMGGLMAPENLTELPAVQRWLQCAAGVVKRVQQCCGDVADEAVRLNTAIEQNVLLQLEHLKTHPPVTQALQRGDLELHGWVYTFETGDVRQYDAATERFVPLA